MYLRGHDTKKSLHQACLNREVDTMVIYRRRELFACPLPLSVTGTISLVLDTVVKDDWKDYDA